MKKAITTAGTANTAEKREFVWVCPNTHRVNTEKNQKFKPFAVPAVFAVVRLRFQG